MHYALWPLSYALTVPAAALLGVRATLVVGGLAKRLVTIAFLFLPGMRDVEREGRLRAADPVKRATPQEIQADALPQPVSSAPAQSYGCVVARRMRQRP